MSDVHYVHGIFKEELKNRFLCIVTIDNKDVLCYIPSSCRLSNFIDMRDRKVLLTLINTAKARTRYSVFAIWYKRRYIPVNLSNINAVVFNNIHRRIFSFLGKRKQVMREVSICGYKSDIYIADTKTIIEIKCILSFKDQTFFPSVYSERAINQLKQIKQLLKEEYKVTYLFVCLCPNVSHIYINPSISEYYELFTECINNGMQTYGYSVLFNGQEITMGKKIPLVIFGKAN